MIFARIFDAIVPSYQSERAFYDRCGRYPTKAESRALRRGGTR